LRVFRQDASANLYGCRTSETASRDSDGLEEHSSPHRAFYRWFDGGKEVSAVNGWS